jgi:hypothetical protein
MFGLMRRRGMMGLCGLIAGPAPVTGVGAGLGVGVDI